MRFASALIATLVAVALSSIAHAVTLIPAASRADMVHDAKRGLVYVTNGPYLLRYDLATSTLLPPITLGGNLMGADLSPDEDTLVVADTAGSSTDSWVYLVSLDSLAITQVKVPKAFGEGGTYVAVYGADGNVYTTSTFNGSGWIPFRRLDVANGTWTTLASVRQDTMLSPSGSAQNIAFAEANTSDGAWGTYDIWSGQIVRREGYTDGTSWFNYEIATDQYGLQFAIPTYGGTFVYDDLYEKIGTLGVYAGGQPIGVAYHPVDEIAYFPWATTSQVRVYDMTTLTQVGAYDFGDQFGSNGNWAFMQGRTRLSRDGSLLMVSVTGGIALQNQYAALHAGDISTATNVGQAVSVPLQGSIGNNGSLKYEILAAPAHGTATLTNAVATYTPAGGFAGGDSFAYRVHYGRAVADARVTVAVAIPDSPPVAYNQAVNGTEDTVSAIVLQASDADGDALSYAIVTQPQHGALSGSGANRTYTPAANFNGTDSFTFQASDGQATSNIATVTIQIASANDPPIAYGQTVNATEDTAANIVLQASDADGDALTYSIVTQPQHGHVGGSGVYWTYQPNANYNGADSFTFIANDGKATSNVATVSIVVASVNDPPQPAVDFVNVAKNASITIDVLANDVDIDGDTLALASVGAPAHGTATISNNKVIYTPTRSYAGSDQFAYTVTDGHGGVAAGAVYVTVLKK